MPADSAANVQRFRLPRRRWVVESRPGLGLGGKWKRSLGPFFRERTAQDYMRRCKWFDAGIVEWRVRRV